VTLLGLTGPSLPSTVSEELKITNNFLFVVNLVAGGLAFLLLVVMAPGALMGVDDAMFKGMGLEDGDVLGLSRPIALLALLCPILSAVTKFTAAARISVKVQAVLLMGTVCCSVLAVHSSMLPLFKIIGDLG
jgi:hypothetical protein